MEYFDKAYQQDASNIDIIRGVVFGAIQARELSKAEGDVEQVRTRAARDQQRLDAGQVNSPKELEGLQHEINTLAKRQSDLEDIVLDVMERLESSQSLQSELTAQKVADEIKEDEFKDLLTRMQVALGERASRVRLTHRLTDSPACLVGDDHGLSRHLERMMRASGQPMPATKPVLEINPDHPIVQRLKQEQDENLFSDWSQILFDQALLAEGGELDDPATFVKRLNKLTLTLAGGNASKIWTP